MNSRTETEGYDNLEILFGEIKNYELVENFTGLIGA
jgi:hypothetical protein